jgi:hypothetical protein
MHLMVMRAQALALYQIGGKGLLVMAHHAMCCQHIAENIHKRFGKESKTRFWQIARMSTRSAFDIVGVTLNEP